MRVTAYLTVILVNHNFKGFGHVVSTHLKFFAPSSFYPMGLLYAQSIDIWMKYGALTKLFKLTDHVLAQLWW